MTTQEPSVRIEVPIKTVSEANRREHWAERAERVRQQRSLARMMLATNTARAPVGALRIRLTRIAPGMLDSDNVHGALKAVRDGVADYLGVDDGDESLTWEVAQERGAPKTYAVRIEIWPRAAECAPMPPPSAKSLPIEAQP